MPAPDHDARRIEVARAAVHSIARSGLDGTALRAVADEGGWSVGVVQHYFRTKTELLVAAVEYLAERSYILAQSLDKTEDSLQQLSDFIYAIVPQLGESEGRYWRVWTCFWAQATTDPILAVAVEYQAQRWRELFAMMIRRGQADDSMRSNLSPEDEGAYLAAAISGLGVMAAADSSAATIPQAITRLLQPLCADGRSVPAPRQGSRARLASIPGEFLGFSAEPSSTQPSRKVG